MENDKDKSMRETNKKNSENEKVFFLTQNSEFLNSEFNEEESKASKQDKIGIELIEKAPDKNFEHELKHKIKRKEKKRKKQEFNNVFEEDEFENYSHSSSENGLFNLDYMSNICKNNEGKDEKITSRKTIRDGPSNFSFPKKSLDA